MRQLNLKTNKTYQTASPYYMVRLTSKEQAGCGWLGTLYLKDGLLNENPFLFNETGHCYGRPEFNIVRPTIEVGGKYVAEDKSGNGILHNFEVIACYSEGESYKVKHSSGQVFFWYPAETLRFDWADEEEVQCKHERIVNVSFSDAHPTWACAKCGQEIK